MNIKYALTIVCCCCMLAKTVVAQVAPTKGLKDYYAGYFSVGVAVGPKDLIGDEAQLIRQEFNSLTAENAMKMESLQPKEGWFNWQIADSIVNFAQRNGMKVRGHNLCWHQQTPEWIFKDSLGKEVTKPVLLQRLKNHITTVVNRYKGKVYAWDVVNEVIDDDSTKLLRNSKWYQICGEDFIIKAFQYAHEADPTAKLFYNDYNTERPEKRERVYSFLKRLIDQGVPIHGVGLQAHWSIYEPTENELRIAIDRYAALGLEIQFTELDISIYPWEKNNRKKRPDEFDGLTPSLADQQANKYAMVFKVFRDYRNVITNITFWNLSDRYTWLDDYPVSGRKNYPLLFDTTLQRKRAYDKVIDFKK